MCHFSLFCFGSQLHDADFLKEFFLFLVNISTLAEKLLQN